MTITTQKFVRVPFYVDAIRVTTENMQSVAEWSKGELVSDEKNVDTHIQVNVHRPLTERQTKAFPGDWVLYAGKGFKVYTNKAFEKSFDEAPVKSNLDEASTEKLQAFKENLQAQPTRAIPKPPTKKVGGYKSTDQIVSEMPDPTTTSDPETENDGDHTDPLPSAPVTVAPAEPETSLQVVEEPVEGATDGAENVSIKPENKRKFVQA